MLDLGAQIQMTVARYRSGQEFAALYARSRFSGTCQALVPQAVAAAPPVPDPPEEATVKQSSGGQVAYSCDGGRTAYVYAKTALYPAFWQVHSLASFVAPSDQVPSARAIVEHCAKSFKLAEGWIQYQKKLDQEALQYQKLRQEGRVRVLSQQVAQFAMQMQATRNQVASFERREAGQAKQVESWGNTLTGVTPTTDPLGNSHMVSTGTRSRYWMDGKGNYANSNTSPGPGWQELQPKQ